mmetsp:Transcript_44575/g.121471  ORF Transcript_44575/g.121471 Transcript_44575/m.121471 type:complete len:225 (+) Transcript_44575:447-1121(+)
MRSATLVPLVRGCNLPTWLHGRCAPAQQQRPPSQPPHLRGATLELARGLSVDMELEWLSLHSNLIGDRGAVALAESLSEYVRAGQPPPSANHSTSPSICIHARSVSTTHHPSHPALEMLSLWDNDIGDEGVIALARSVQTNQIRELSLAQNPRITDRGVIFLAKTLKDSKGNLTTLWLHGLPLVSETGRRELAATLRGDASHIFTLMDDHAPDDGHPLVRLAHQ